MDFEYNNGIGPVDAASPWLSRSRNNAGSVQPQTLNNPERKREQLCGSHHTNETD